jgi:hypothetical protein
MTKNDEGTIAREDEGFDCIAFKRRVQAEIYEETKGMTHEEEIAYFHRRVAEGPFGKWWGSLEKAALVVREKPGDRGADDRGC